LVQWLTWSEVRGIREGKSGEKVKLWREEVEEGVAGLPAMVDLRRGRERVETRFPSSAVEWSLNNLDSQLSFTFAFLTRNHMLIYHSSVTNSIMEYQFSFFFFLI
jgi:hypothetical protein